MTPDDSPTPELETYVALQRMLGFIRVTLRLTLVVYAILVTTRSPETITAIQWLVWKSDGWFPLGVFLAWGAFDAPLLWRFTGHTFRVSCRLYAERRQNVLGAPLHPNPVLGLLQAVARALRRIWRWTARTAYTRAAWDRYLLRINQKPGADNGAILRAEREDVKEWYDADVLELEEMNGKYAVRVAAARTIEAKAKEANDPENFVEAVPIMKVASLIARIGRVPIADLRALGMSKHSAEDISKAFKAKRFLLYSSLEAQTPLGREPVAFPNKMADFRTELNPVLMTVPDHERIEVILETIRGRYDGKVLIARRVVGTPTPMLERLPSVAVQRTAPR